MSTTQNPFGLHTITPYLIVNSATQLIQFLKEVFNATLRGEISYRDDGSVQHAELKIGDSYIMMGEPLPDMEFTICGMYVYVEDCNAVFQKALQAGALSILEPANYPHGDRYGGVKDFAGNTWWIVTHIGNTQTSI